MKKLFLIAAAGLVLLAGVAAWTRIIRSSSSDIVVPEYVFTYAENQQEDYPTTQGAKYFAALVREKTQEGIDIRIYSGAELGDEKSIVDQLRIGGVDFARVSLSSLGDSIPKLNVLQLPYLYTGREHMWEILDGEIGNEFLQAFEGTGLVALSWYDAGARNFYTSKKPIEKLEDFQGLNMRVQESELMVDLVKALGANAVPLTYTDVYSALQTGKIDGAENNWPSYESMNHHEVARYYTVDEHTRIPEVQLVSQSTWDKLTPEYQDIIKECAQASALYERALWAEREKTSEKAVKLKGCQVTVLSAEEKELFQQAAAPLYEKYCSEYTELIDAIVSAGKE